MQCPGKCAVPIQGFFEPQGGRCVHKFFYRRAASEGRTWCCRVFFWNLASAMTGGLRATNQCSEYCLDCKVRVRRDPNHNLEKLR